MAEPEQDGASGPFDSIKDLWEYLVASGVGLLVLFGLIMLAWTACSTGYPASATSETSVVLELTDDDR